MDANKFVEMRKQIEENNEDIRNFLGDFDQWRSDVERKSAKMRAKAIDGENVPPIRNILHKKRKMKKVFAFTLLRKFSLLVRKVMKSKIGLNQMIIRPGTHLTSIKPWRMLTSLKVKNQLAKVIPMMNGRTKGV